MCSLATPLATIGIQSIGDMGLGIAKLLTANNFRVITYAANRSQATQNRAESNAIELIPTEADLCNTSDYILSIVPPRDAIANAQRIINAISCSSTPRRQSSPLYYLDLNAISPKSARTINDIFAPTQAIHFIDGGIIGPPPSRKPDGTWIRPSIPISGPHRLDEAQPAGAKLAQVLNTKHINDNIGSATGLKMCFASLTKGFTALAIQSFTTAHNLGVVSELQEEMKVWNPSGLSNAEKSLPGMCPKAYRWVHEMREIAETFEADGGFEESESVFRAAAEIYDLVANGTELGKEVTEDRRRGKNVEDVAALVSEGTERRKVKTD